MALADCLVAEQPPLRLEPDGTIRVGKSRVTLDIVLESYLEGQTPEQIGADLTTLDVGDIYAAIGHYHRHKAEFDEYLRQRNLKAEEVRRLWDTAAPSAGLRERLIGRVRATTRRG